MVWFRKDKEPRESITDKKVPGGIWIKCNSCKQIVFKKEVDTNFKVCLKCNYHFKLTSKERLKLVFGHENYKEVEAGLKSQDPLKFKDKKRYRDRLKDYHELTNLYDANIVVEGSIGLHFVVVSVMDFSFIGGSMGSVVGEKITRSFERGMQKKCSVIIICCSGGARMQEGILSLMQMAKTSSAVQRFGKTGLLYISILTDPTTAGVMASFASLGDLILAEPNALIGFAGERVIRQTIGENLPPGFQRSEFLLEHGFIDRVVERKNLHSELVNILDFFEIQDHKEDSDKSTPGTSEPI
ncbi:acetyl-CoA carboxylase, carboxyltransferase subunit beta [bacterium]|nr:acetyl-CoA carboxylase, carboxyltransferase subunit beta [bacterium]